MHRTRLALPSIVAAAAAGLASTAGSARAGVIEQSFTYSWDSGEPQHTFAFQPFDTMGGTRELTGVRLGFEGTLEMEVTAHTYEGALRAGEWFADASHIAVAYFNGGKDGLELFQPIAGLGAEEITGDLGAGDGQGNPGTPYVYTDSLFVAGVVEIESAYFEDISGGSPLVGFMDGFFDGAVMPPPSEQWIELIATRLAQEGTVTLTYEYRSVPTPGSLALLGACGLAAFRRRR